MNVADFITLWSTSGASERANKDSYLKDLADVLGVPHPAPRTGESLSELGIAVSLEAGKGRRWMRMRAAA